MTTVDVDVLVAGGGPVGLAAGLHARARGLSVLVAEPRSDPVDKACGEGLMPSAVAELERLGVEPAGWPFVGIRYLAPGRAAVARFRAGPGRGVRRTVLHDTLREHADRAGVQRHTATLTEVIARPDVVVANGLRARWLIAADGLHSPLRRALGLQGAPGGPVRFGLRRHFAMAPWTDYVEVHWSPRAEAYVTPVAADLVGVAVLGPAGPSFAESLEEFGTLAARLRGARAVTDVRGAGPMRQAVTTPRQGRVLLVGDAAGYVDALTGEGIAVGLATARAALDAVAAGRPDRYPAAWRRVSRRYRWSAGALVAATARPQVRSRLVPVAAHAPALFRLAVNHVA